jgi:hypothetical protein
VDLNWFGHFNPYRLWSWLPIAIGLGVAFLVLLGGAWFISYWKNIPLLDLLLLRRRKPPPPTAEPTESENAIAPLALEYLATPQQDLSYLAKEDERRATKRYWGNPIEVRITSVLHPSPRRGAVVNRSTGGIAILVDDKYETGAMLKVRAVLAPKDVAWVDIEVRNCRSAGKNYVIGCCYPAPPPWKAMAWLG